MNEKHSSTEEIVKRTSERIWDATSRTFHQASVKAGHYRALVQKKIDLGTIHRRIDHLQHDLGQTVDDMFTHGQADIMSQPSVREMLGQLRELRTQAEAIEVDMAHLRESGVTPEDDPKH